MKGETFRVMGNYAVDQIAKFLDEFPEFYPVMKIRGEFGTLVVGLEDKPVEESGIEVKEIMDEDEDE